MKKRTVSLTMFFATGLVLASFSLAFSIALPLQARAASDAKTKEKHSSSLSGSTEELQTVTTVVADLIPFENGFIIRRPLNEGKALKIQDAMAFTEAKLRYLQDANASKNPIQVVVKGTQVVDILTH